MQNKNPVYVDESINYTATVVNAKFFQEQGNARYYDVAHLNVVRNGVLVALLHFDQPQTAEDVLRAAYGVAEKDLVERLGFAGIVDVARDLSEYLDDDDMPLNFNICIDASLPYADCIMSSYTRAGK